MLAELCVSLAWPAPGMRLSLPDLAGALGLSLSLGIISGLLARLLWRRAPRGVELVPLAALLGPQLLRPFDLDYSWDPVLSVGLLVLPWLLPRIATVAGACVTLAVPVVVAAGLERGQGSLPPPRQAPPPGPDLLLITVDTLRADAGLVLPDPERWRIYEQAVSAAPWTLPAMLSLFAGQPVREHLGGLPAERGGGYTLAAETSLWLPAAFGERGYLTAAFTCNAYLGRPFGFDRGFHRFVHAAAFREPFQARSGWERAKHQLSGRVPRLWRERDERVVDEALRWLATPSERPRFTWVHLLAPHEYSRHVASPVPGWVPDTEEVAPLRAGYAANVRSTQDLVASLVDAVEREETLVVFTADHGEQLGEDGVFGHGLTLGDHELRVPLALTGPGVASGVVEEQVATADLAPVLLGLVDGAFVELPVRDSLPVAGLRRRGKDPSFAERQAGTEGVYTPDQGARHELHRAEVMVPDADTRRALRALGYVD